jgi:hypothetical protein
MPATPEATARTRTFARVIGPFLVIVPGIVMVRAPNTGAALTGFFENAALAWLTGGWLVFGGLLIIAQHQYWSSLAAILISLFGWFLALRGVVLLAAPELIENAATAAVPNAGAGRRIAPVELRAHPAGADVAHAVRVLRAHLPERALHGARAAAVRATEARTGKAFRLASASPPSASTG